MNCFAQIGECLFLGRIGPKVEGKPVPVTRFAGLQNKIGKNALVEGGFERNGRIAIKKLKSPH